ncbi:MAG: hypothetical protein LUD68_00975 [Rikenellaceae bacterium]|nr:hypothetical protein [Rikenellaceae bacterium]
MDFLYNKVYLAYKNRAPVTGTVKLNGSLSFKGVLYATTGGEARHIRGRTLAVDGMNNVIDFLELLENEKIKGVDYLELRACDQSCAGGILSHRNRFLGAETLQRYADTKGDTHDLVEDYKKHASANIHMAPIEPRSLVKYDRNIEIALKKMEQAQLLQKMLPEIDCGACGAPSCESLAGDIVRGEKEIKSCIFLRTRYEKHGDITPQEAMGMMKAI